MGKTISEEGHWDDPIGAESIKKLKKKSNVGGLHKLSRFIGYSCASIRNFSRKAKPLYDLLSTPVTTKSKQKKFQQNQKVKNHPVHRLIGQTSTKLL